MSEETDVGATDDRISWRAVCVATAVTIVTIMPLFLVGAMSMQLRDEFAFGLTALGTLVAFFRLGAVVLSPMLGRATDRIGAVRTLRYALLIAATSTIGVAFFARSWATLAVGMFGCGVSSSWGQLAANRYLIRVVRDGRQGLAFGIKQASMPAGAMLSGLAVPLVALTLGWRAAFLMSAGSSLMLLPFLPMTSIAQRAIAQKERHRTQFTGSVRVLAFGFVFAAATGSTLGAFTVESGIEQGFDVRTAAMMLTLGSLLSIVLRVALGQFSDTWKGGHLALVAGLLATGSIGFAMLGIGGAATTLIAIPIVFGAGWSFNGLFWSAVLRLRPDSPGETAGVIMPGGMAGAIFGPILFGIVAERLSYRLAWLMVAGFALIAAYLIRLGSRMQDAEFA